MTHEKNVGQPRKVVLVFGAAEQKSARGKSLRDINKQCLEHLIAIGRPSTHIREIGAVMVVRGDRSVDIRIDASIERRYPSGAQHAPQFVERSAARITEDQIEITVPARAQIRHLLALAETPESHRCVKIVEDAK